MKRAELGIHSNSAFARLLTESVLVKIETTAEPGSPGWRNAGRHAAMVAYHKLQERLPDQSFSFFFAPSHPNYQAPDGSPGKAEAAPISDIAAKPVRCGTDAEPEVTSQRAA